MKTKIFIDFDDTLFDRSRFSTDLFAIIKKYGFSDDEIQGSYRLVYSDGYDGIWSHLKFLHDKIRSFDLPSAETEINKFLKSAKSYLFPESIPFLEGIDRNIFDVQLLTVGGLDFQKLKVESAGIKRFFDHCNFTTKKKAETLKGLVSQGESFVLVEDKDKEIAEVNEKFPHAILVQARGGNLMECLKTINAKVKTNED